MPHPQANYPAGHHLPSVLSGSRYVVSAIGVIAILGGSLEIRHAAHTRGFDVPGFPFRFGGATLDYLIAVAFAGGGAALLAPAARRHLAEALGLRWRSWRGPTLVLLATMPCWVGLALRGKVAQKTDVFGLFFLAVLFPLAEEVIFRGFGFVFTRRALGWRFAPAALLQAAIFGVLHWMNAPVGSSEAGVQILVVTLFGGLYFAVMDSLDGDTIWSGWIFHVSINLAWGVFAVSNTAATDWVGNALRIGSAVLAVRLLRFVGKPAPTPPPSWDAHGANSIVNTP